MSDLAIREGTPADAEAIHTLIQSHEREGHLLPRDLDDIRRRAGRFVVAVEGGVVKACAELAPLSANVAEVRSLVVAKDVRRVGLAAQLVNHIAERGRGDGFTTLCAFTHDPRFFVRRNFSIVPHQWLPAKIAKDCTSCQFFRRCGQYAMVLPLREVIRYSTPDVEHHPAAVA